MTENLQKNQINNDKKAEISLATEKQNDRNAKKEQNNQSHFAQSNFI